MIDRALRDDFERIRLGGAGRDRAREHPSGGGAPAFVGQVTSGSGSIGVGQFLMVQPTTVLGAEVEAGPGQLAATSASSVPVYLLGPGLPANGDYLVCRYVDNRWVAERTSPAKPGGVTVPIPNCSCAQMPATLTMTSRDQTCNYGMFQSCTLQYVPIPDAYAPLYLGPTAFLSAQSFPDPIINGSMFQYLLTCRYNQFGLSRIYATSPYGSPYRDGVIYSWIIGGYGNTCSPFHLDNGSAYPGSDASCFVTIDGA